MSHTLYQVDAFTDQVFGGNPAAVVPLDDWLPDDLMQRIALENNLSETAFYVKEGDAYRIRWFTPEVEVALCGHATLATAYVLFEQEEHPGDHIQFMTMERGALTVKRSAKGYQMDFPADHVKQIEEVADWQKGFNHSPLEAWRGLTDIMLVFDSEHTIRDLLPNIDVLNTWEARGVIVTAPGKGCDFVSRFFAPQCGIFEDPVTGSAHTTLAPYWAKRLGKSQLEAQQLSARVGHLWCEATDDRVKISGQARLYMKGQANW